MPVLCAVLGTACRSRAGPGQEEPVLWALRADDHAWLQRRRQRLAGVVVALPPAPASPLAEVVPFPQPLTFSLLPFWRAKTQEHSKDDCIYRQS